MFRSVAAPLARCRHVRGAVGEFYECPRILSMPSPVTIIAPRLRPVAERQATTRGPHRPREAPAKRILGIGINRPLPHRIFVRKSRKPPAEPGWGHRFLSDGQRRGRRLPRPSRGAGRFNCRCIQAGSASTRPPATGRHSSVPSDSRRRIAQCAAGWRTHAGAEDGRKGLLLSRSKAALWELGIRGTRILSVARLKGRSFSLNRRSGCHRDGTSHLFRAKDHRLPILGHQGADFLV